MIESLLAFAHSIGSWSYLLLFAVVFAECTLFTSVVVPGELIVVLSGFLAMQGVLGLGETLAVVLAGAVLSYPAGFWLGRRLGAGYFRTHDRFLFLREKHIARVRSYLDEHGGKTILFSRFVGFLRAMAPFTAGMGGMAWGRFLLYSVVGGVVWAIAFVLLGYFLGESWLLVERWMGRAGLFLLFLLALLALFAWAYRRLVRGQEQVRAWALRWFGWAWDPLCRLAGRFPRATAFVGERLSPRGYLGLHLTLGLALCSLLVAAFVVVAANAVPDRPLLDLDRLLLDEVLTFRHPGVTRFMLVLTQLGAAPFLSLASLVLVAFFLGLRRLEYLAGYLAGLAGGSVLVFVLKQSVQRARPLTETLIGRAYEFSFPSGHAMMSVIFYGLVVYFAVREARSWRLGVFLSLAASFLVLLIGISRVYLQAQWASDVLAGFVGGLFWLTVCLTGLEVYRRMSEAGKECAAA